MTGLDAPELAAYQDQPRQLPSGAPGKHGALDLTFERRGARSVLAGARHRAPLLVQRALYRDEHLPGMPCVYMIATSGCLLQGDRLDIAVTLGVGAMAHLTTQAATKVHQMDANFAAQSVRLTLAENAYLEFMPSPTIPHRHSRFSSRTQASVAADATLLCADVILGGRKHYRGGELFEYDLYSSTLTAARPDGLRLFTDKFIAQPERQRMRDAGVMGGFDVLATVALITPARHVEPILDQITPGLDLATGCLSGASRLPNDAGLSYKVVGPESEPVRAMVRQFWALVRRQVVGAALPAAPLWGKATNRVFRQFAGPVSAGPHGGR